MQNDSFRPSNAEIVRQVLDGKVNAFESILTRYKVQVLKIVKKHVPNDAVEETTQEAFVRTYESLPTFKGTGDFSQWLSSIAVTKELRLTEAQQKKFKGIVEETDKKLEAFGLERRAEIKTILDESFSRMKEKLDPEQQKKLEELKARHEARLKDKKSKHHFP